MSEGRGLLKFLKGLVKSLEDNAAGGLVEDETLVHGLSQDFADRFQHLVGVLREIDPPAEAQFSGLYYLHRLLGSGHLRDLKLEIVAKIDALGTRRMAFIPPQAPDTLQLDNRLMLAFAKLRLPPHRRLAAIDSFLIHELLHFAQHMGFGRHSGLGRQSPWTLLAIDYQADALCAAIQTQLRMVSGDSLDDWQIHLESIQAVIDQMDVFTALSRADLDRSQVARMPFTYDKLQRVAVWQLQYHRARLFNRDLALADLQILAQPFLHFRTLEVGLAGHHDAIHRDWPKREQAIFDDVQRRAEQDPPMIISAVSRFGTTAFARCNLAAALHAQLFEAFFSGDLTDSGAAFEAIFDEHPWLIGNSDNGGDDWNGPGGPDDPDFPPLSVGTLEGLDDGSAWARPRMAFTSRLFPLTVFQALPGSA